MVDLTITIRYLSIFLSIAVSPLIMPEYALAIPFQDSKEIKAGPIYSNRDARKKCPGICLRADATWTGKWHRVSSGVMSACQCAIDNTVSDNSTCTLDEICKSFRIINEYNNNATKEGGLCWKWLKHSHCALGIPREALLFYEIEIKGGKAYYKLDNKPFNSWFGGHKETLYIINARNNKIYFINVDGRYIEARGTANCIEQKVKEGQSTIECKIPRLTTHAGQLHQSKTIEQSNFVRCL